LPRRGGDVGVAGYAGGKHKLVQGVKYLILKIDHACDGELRGGGHQK
jgi:hypothetical protein